MAGLGALMKDLHPDWSPMMIKSAFMTTAYQEDTAGGSFGDVFDYGSGHVNPNPATDPGLVYNAGFNDWLGFLCGTGELQAGFCPQLQIDPSDLNQASIAIGSLAGSQTVTRTVTNVGPDATYHVSVDAVDGVDVTVSPSNLTLANGESATYSVTFTTNQTATLNAYTSGSLTWTHGPHQVRSPVAVRPVAVAAPEEVHSDGSPISYEIGFGFDGAFSADARGLVDADAQLGTVVDDPANDINVALETGVGITEHIMTIPAGTTLARFSLFDDFTSGDDDLDLYVFDADTEDLLGGSGSGTSAEEINLVNPGALDVRVVVHGWQTDGGAPADYTLFSWMLDGADAGNMTVVAPANGVLSGTANIDLSFSGLIAGTKYLGAIDYTLAGSDGGTTIVRVDP
jgi:hypothetical protein